MNCKSLNLVGVYNVIIYISFISILLNYNQLLKLFYNVHFEVISTPWDQFTNVIKSSSIRFFDAHRHTVTCVSLE